MQLTSPIRPEPPTDITIDHRLTASNMTTSHSVSLAEREELHMERVWADFDIMQQNKSLASENISVS